MTNRFSTHAFIAGELAPEFRSRTDLDKYALGVSLARNFYIDFRGGLKSAPGTAFVEEVDGPGRLFSFPLVSGVAEVQLYFGVEELLIFDPAGTETIATSYALEDLQNITYDYRTLRAVVTCSGHPPKELTYDVTDGWSFADISFSSSISSPTGLAVTTYKDGTGVSTGDAKAIFVVSALDAEGNESLSSIPVIFDNLFNYAAEAGNAALSWTAVTGATSYRIYRSAIVENAVFTRAQDVGYIGETRAPSFVDANITPDYTVQPPLQFNPFAEGAITEISITTGGSGYSEASTISISGGTGFAGYPLVSGGALVGVVILNGGEGYTTGSTITVSGGTGGVAAIEEVSPSDGLYPSCSTRMQNRRLYAGQVNAPLTIYGAKPYTETNFDYSSVPSANDGYVLPIDNESSRPITHMQQMQDSLIVFHAGGVETLRAAEGSGISAVNYTFRNQTNLGASNCTPAVAGSDLLYASTRGTQIIALTYTYYTNSFSEQDVSVLAPHLFGSGLEPKRFVWQREPDKLLWVLRADGTLAVLTYMREQEIYAWAQRTTDGIIHDICLLRSERYDYVRLLVERDGSYFIEAMEERVPYPAEEYWGVDCGLRYEGTIVEGSLKIEPNGTEGEVTLTRPSGSFAGTVDDYVRAGRGLYLILEVLTATTARAQAVRSATHFLGDGITTNGSTWSIATPVSSVSGLDHLEGRSVAILADGNPLPEQVVTSGAISFSQSYSLITVGLPYVCEAETLPLSQPQLQSDGKTKRIVGSALRVHETRGLEAGSGVLYEIKPKVPDFYGQSTELLSETVELLHESKWQIDATMSFRQGYPLPASVLGYVTELEMSDD